MGLDFFTEDKADYFFGRDHDRARVIFNLQGRTRFTVLYAESGVGKSSLLRAGVAARLTLSAKQGPWRLVPVLVSRWNGDPVVTVVDELQRVMRWIVPSASEIELPRDRLDESVTIVASEIGATPVIILDQFEDYFTYHAGKDGGGSLASELSGLAEPSKTRAKVLISIREDALGQLDRFKGRIPEVLGNRIDIRRLSDEQARTAIEGPIKRYNSERPDDPDVEIEPGLVEALLADLSAGGVTIGATARGGGANPKKVTQRVEAPFLQLVMTRLWEEEMASSSQALRLSTLEDLGGAAVIVRTHLDTAMSRFDEAEQDVAACIFQQLVTPSGNKIAHSVPDLAELSNRPQERVAAVIERLTGGEVRILRPVAPNGARLEGVEIFHDVLAPAILAWRSRYMRRQRDARLEEERRIAEEARRRELKNRFFRILALALIVAVIGTAVLTIIALRERDKAESSALMARSSALVAQSVAQVADDPELGVILAREGLQRAETEEAADALVRGLSEMRLIATMRGHPAELAPMPRDGSAFTPDGRRVVTASGNGATIWSVSSGARLRSLSGHGNEVFGASFSPDGGMVVTASLDGTARIWDARTGRMRHVLRGPSTGVREAQFSRDGHLILTSGGAAKTAQVWSATTGRLLRTIHARDGVYTAVFDRRADRVLTSEDDSVARLWDVRSGRLLRELRGHTDVVYGAVFDPADRSIVTSSLDGTARLWNARTGRAIARLDGIGQTAPAEFSANGKLVVTAGERDAHVWNARTGARVATLQAHADALISASFSPDGTLVATASEDQTAIVWDIAAERPLRELRGHTGTVMSAIFTPSGRRLVTGGEDRTARVWNVDPGIVFRQNRAGVRSVAFSPDGRMLASGGEDGTARIWDVRSRRMLGREMRHSAAINRVAFSPDGRRIVTASSDQTAIIWDVPTGRAVQRFALDTPEPADAINAAAFSPNGKAVVVATSFSGAQVFAAATGRKVSTLPHGDVVYDASFSADSERIVTAALDGRARIWDASRGRRPIALRGHRGGVIAASFSPDGRLVVTGSSDRTAIVWAAASGRRLRVLSGHTGQVNAARFSPDGRRVVTAGETATHVWSSRSGRLLGILPAHADVVRDVSFAPRGNLIASASDDRTVRLYRCGTCVPVRELEALAARRATRSLTPVEQQRFLGRD
jgi:WD40 repeat protein